MYPQTRRLPYRKQLKRFVISCEGSQTEREYFTCIQPLCWDRSYVDILTSRNETSPLHVLDRLRNYKKSLRPGDEMWCVVDKDQWTQEQLEELIRWQKEPSRIMRGVALSNPKFELWLLAHFRELPRQCGSSECDRLLEEYQPGYKKHINRQLFTKEAVSLAVERSISSCPDGVLPLGSVGTNVGELVRRILADTARVS